MSGQTLGWIALVAAGLGAIAIDLLLTFRGRHQSVRAAVVASIGWAIAGVAFAAVVRLALGAGEAGDYLTVFLLEKSLSLDNVAVFAVVLSAFAIPYEGRHRVLVGGILIALVLRLAFVAGGLALVSTIHGVLVVFGVILLVAGVRMIVPGEHSDEPPRAVRWLQRRRINTAVAALLALAVTDLVFAVDSVPAAFAVSKNAYPIVAANVFAVLGLRPLYDLLAAAIQRLGYLERALGGLLVLIGVALCIEPLWKVPEWVILTGVVVTLGTGVVLSLVPPRRVFVTVGGGVLLAAGAAMLVLPGPGLLVIAAGLALLATEFVWARRMLDRVKARIPQRPGKRSVSRSRAEPGTPEQPDPRTASAP